MRTSNDHSLDIDPPGPTQLTHAELARRPLGPRALCVIAPGATPARKY